jgi:hypothetical protein
MHNLEMHHGGRDVYIARTAGGRRLLPPGLITQGVPRAALALLQDPLEP